MDLLKILDTKPLPAIVDARTLGISDDTSGDYWLPTTMCLYQKELTDQIVSLHYSDILRYFETKNYKEDVIVQSMKTMCLNSAFVSTHPYLLIDHYMPKSLITKDIPVHLAETSGKFTALRDLMTLVQEYETHTAIVCRPGRTMDLLEALLLGNKVNIKRYDNHSIKSKQKPKNFSCTCHIFPSENLDLNKSPIKCSGQFDMLISLDPTVDTEQKEIQSILQHQRDSKGSESHSPIVRLVTINSVDHCELYFGKVYQKNSREFLENVTAAVVVLRDRVGTLPPDLRPIYSQNLKYLIEWLEDPSISWPLPDLYRIKKYTSMDVERSLLTEVHYSQIEDELEAAFRNGKKRGRSKSERDTSKTAEIGSFYQSKRLKNDYTTNPIRQGMAQLTGISTADDVSNTDYHLCSGILTHRLIQSIGQTYMDLEMQLHEIKSYGDMNPIQQSHENHFNNELASMESKLTDISILNLQTVKRSEEIDRLNKEKHLDIDGLSAEVDQLLEKLSARGEKHTALKSLFLSQTGLQEDLIKEKSLSHSRETEKEYTSKECERAEKSCQDSGKEIESLDSKQEILKTQFQKMSEEASEAKFKVIESIVNLKSSIEGETTKYSQLKLNVKEVVEKLNSLPTPRARLSTGKNHSGRRYKSSALKL